MLGHRPLRHLPQPDEGEDGGGQRLRGQREQAPPGDLGGVVRAGDKVEQEAAGDDVARGSRGPQVGQDQMTPARKVVETFAKLSFDQKSHVTALRRRQAIH